MINIIFNKINSTFIPSIFNVGLENAQNSLATLIILVLKYILKLYIIYTLKTYFPILAVVIILSPMQIVLIYIFFMKIKEYICKYLSTFKNITLKLSKILIQIWLIIYISTCISMLIALSIIFIELIQYSYYISSANTLEIITLTLEELL